MNYLEFWNTSNVTNMSYCFYKQINFNQRLFWNTQNVENTAYLFYKCKKLKFNNIKSIINKLVIKSSNKVDELEKEIDYKIPEEYKNKITNKSFYITNQI